MLHLIFGHDDGLLLDLSDQQRLTLRHHRIRWMRNVEISEFSCTDVAKWARHPIILFASTSDE